MYSKVYQLYIYILFHILFHYVYHRIWNIVPCAIHYDLMVYQSYIYQFVPADPKLPILPSPTLPPLSNHKSVLHDCDLFLFHMGMSMRVCLVVSDSLGLHGL